MNLAAVGLTEASAQGLEGPGRIYIASLVALPLLSSKQTSPHHFCVKTTMIYEFYC
jgi:hypothetical protein